MNYVFHPAAEKEYLEAVAFYELKRPGLGTSYVTEFEQNLLKVCSSPQRYPIVIEHDIRAINMNRFPYTVLFREVSTTVQILAIAHHRRHPKYWLERL